jgi:FkbM family methyltransferase
MAMNIGPTRPVKRWLEIARLPLDIMPLAMGPKEKLGLLRYTAVNLLDKLRHERRELVVELQGNRYHVQTCSGELSPFPEINRDNVYEKVPEFVPGAGDVVLDVGSNTGMFSLKQAARGARVYAFEPNPQAYSRLMRNIEENSLADRVSGFQLALGSRPGQAALKAATATVLTRVQFDSQGDVKVDSLDQVIPGLGIDRVQLMKLDVEGAEAEILAGGTQVLDRVERIVMEYHGSERLHQVRAIVGKAGFTEAHSDGSYAYFVNQRLADPGS